MNIVLTNVILIFFQIAEQPSPKEVQVKVEPDDDISSKIHSRMSHVSISNYLILSKK